MTLKKFIVYIILGLVIFVTLCVVAGQFLANLFFGSTPGNMPR